MAKPVYKLFMARPTEAGYQLTEDERNKIWAKHAEISKKLDVKIILICDSYWVSEKWHFWGVEEYPNMDALQKYHEALNEIQWFRYFEAETLLGIRMEG
jgi:hypothetical protein